MSKAKPKLVGPCKTIQELEENTGYKLLDIFPILAGAAVDDLEVAKVLSPALGLSVESLIRPITRLRVGVLVLFSASTGIGKSHVWKALLGQSVFGRKTAQVMAQATDTHLDAWVPGGAKINPYVQIVQAQTASGHKAKAKAAAIAEADAHAVVLADTMLAAGNE